MTKLVVHVLLVFAALGSTATRIDAQATLPNEPVLQSCAEYSDPGDLLTASVSLHAFTVSIVRPSGERAVLDGVLSDAASTSGRANMKIPCRIAVSPSSARAALAILTASGLVLQLIDLSKAQLGQTVKVPPRFPIQFSLHPIGFVNKSEQLAVSQAHYLPDGEPEVSTQLIGTDGSILSDAQVVTGPKYSEVVGSSFDFRGSRVWFLCPAYSVRIDRQPRCTLTSAPLGAAASTASDIPPPPDDRVVGSGQPNLGFPSASLAVLLAQDRLWLYSFSTGTFREMSLPETPHHIRWFEFPGEPKFTSDGRFAAIPVFMSHAPLFEEGSVSHGTKLVVVDLKTFKILRTIQPDNQASLIDFALHNNGKDLTLVADWGGGWKTSAIPTVYGN